LYGNELDEDTNPLEAGLGWTVKLNKGDFLGKEALEVAKAEGLKKQLVGFEVLSRGSARAGYALLDKNGQKVGVCTSGGPSPTLGKAIGLGYLPPASTELGSEFLVDARGRTLEARVVPTPFYRRPK
jgi:aminomethyltransferase